MLDYNKLKKYSILTCAYSNITINYYVRHGGYGEVVNTLDCGSSMQGFDPL